MQESLLDVAGEPALGALAGAVRRVPLARGAWVDLRPGWLEGSAAVFAATGRDGAVAGGETAHVRPGGGRAPAAVLLRRGRAAARPGADRRAGALNAHYGAELGEPFRTAGLCLYRDGRDSVAWHGDTTGRGCREDTMVAILSLGTPRAFLLRPRGGAAVAAVRDRARGPAGHGRQLPAHLGARRAEDGTGRRAADQRAVPAEGRALRAADRSLASSPEAMVNR